MNLDPNKKLHTPLFDRLIDEDPLSQSCHINQTEHQILFEFKESVRRDLETLFNTRYHCVSPPEKNSLLKQSLLNFGLPDVATLGLESTKAKKAFCREIEQAILFYEPRVRSASVTIPSKFDAEDPTIRFRVEAVLHALPAEEKIIFDSDLNPITRCVAVSETRL